jgi:3-hydroxyisobutyrate dehydrogenase-like beta-hydroxyacid dehydrogenase
MQVTVIGLGAMGGGMARSLLRSSSIDTVVGFDLSTEIVQKYYEEAKAAGKSTPSLPSELTINNFVHKSTDVVLVVLVNEAQCESVCFEGQHNLCSIMKEDSCVVVSSTVSAAWSQSAEKRFSEKNIQFCDCPISGGAARALKGEITIMASGHHKSLDYIDPLLKAMGKEIHIIEGGVGMGSTVKMVHQLLAGVHIVVAAEALALAAKAGLDVAQVYEIVKGAAGNSWMFCDRGQRMLDNSDNNVMSALAIFVKDLDIVHAEAKRLQSPVPLAAAALQQFISGQALGLSKKDDSSVVQVYEALNGVSVSQSNSNSIGKEGDEVGDYWVFEDGTKERIVEVGDEPQHNVVLKNEFARVLKVTLPGVGSAGKNTTWAHRHAEDSLYFFLVEGGLNVINHVKGNYPQCDCMEFGEVRYGTHKTEKPLVHKITNRNAEEMLCIDAEVLKTPPITSPLPLMADHHELIKTRDRCRVYRLVLEPGQSTTVSYNFFYLSVVLRGSPIKISLRASGPGPVLSWQKTTSMGDEEWCKPSLDMTIMNTGNSSFEQYIAEWR